MRFRLMATYRGVPYEAGVGPSDSDVVLFAACPPPEDLGFEAAPGHWRKRVIRAEVDVLWESRSVGTFHGEPCLILDDLGDRLHIAYQGQDSRRARELGFWQVDRGVFELLTPREEVTGLSEEKAEKGLPRRGPAAAPPPPSHPYSAPRSPPRATPTATRPRRRSPRPAPGSASRTTAGTATGRERAATGPMPPRPRPTATGAPRRPLQAAGTGRPGWARPVTGLPRRPRPAGPARAPRPPYRRRTGTAR